MESIKRLREICQPKSSKKIPYTEQFYRKFSIYPTKFLLSKTNISANQVTVFSILVGILAGVFFSFGKSWTMLIGAVLLNGWYFIDHLDGEIAKYRRTSSLTGQYFDLMNHYIVHPIVFFGLGIGLYFQYEWLWLIYAGFLASLGGLILNLCHDAQATIITLSGIFKKNLPNEVVIDKSLNVEKENNASQGNILTLVKKAIIICSLFPGTMNCITVASLLEFYEFKFQFFELQIGPMLVLVFSFSIFYPLSCLKALIQIIQKKEIDRKYYYYFEK